VSQVKVRVVEEPAASETSWGESLTLPPLAARDTENVSLKSPTFAATTSTLTLSPCRTAVGALTAVTATSWKGSLTVTGVEEELSAVSTSPGTTEALAVKVYSPRGKPVVSQVKLTVVEEPGASVTD
jgi:hypothetical protein